MRIDLEEIRELVKRRKEINSIPLEKIEWFEDGKPVKIDKRIVENFLITGLNNIDFITSNYYLRKYG